MTLNIYEKQDEGVQLALGDDPESHGRTPGKTTLYEGVQTLAYLWARTILCSDCSGLIPLSPEWRLSITHGVRLRESHIPGIMSYEIVSRDEMSRGTIANGIATCPYPTCGAVMSQGYPAQEAQADRMGQTCYATVHREWWVEYRSGRPYQRKGPHTYRVPPYAVFDSARDRDRFISSRPDLAIPLAPELARLLDPEYEDDGTGLAPGMEALLAWERRAELE